MRDRGFLALVVLLIGMSAVAAFGATNSNSKMADSSVCTFSKAMSAFCPDKTDAAVTMASDKSETSRHCSPNACSDKSGVEKSGGENESAKYIFASYGGSDSSDDKPSAIAQESEESDEMIACHIHDETCETEGCTHEHSTDCVAYYRGYFDSALDEVCAHEHSAECELSGCVHEHGLDCYTALAAAHGHVCNDECRAECDQIKSTLINPCVHVHTEECETNGCTHVCGSECIANFMAAIDMISTHAEKAAAAS